MNQEGQKKPHSGTRDTIEAEVSDPVAIVRSRIKQVMTNLGLNVGRQTLLGRGTRRVIKICVGRKEAPREDSTSERMRPPSRSYSSKPGEIRVQSS